MKCSWEERLSSSWTKFLAVVEKILISKSEKLLDPSHIVSLDTPIAVCEHFGCFNVCVILQPQAPVAHASAYAFQVKKCLSDDCFYCQENPIRLPIAEFKKLHFLPLPLLDLTKEHHRPFEAPHSQTQISPRKL